MVLGSLDGYQRNSAATGVKFRHPTAIFMEVTTMSVFWGLLALLALLPLFWRASAMKARADSDDMKGADDE